MNLTTGELVYIATLMDTERNRVAEKCKPEFTKLCRKIARELSEPDMTEAQLAAYAELKEAAEELKKADDQLLFEQYNGNSGTLYNANLEFDRKKLQLFITLGKFAALDKLEG